ncbi:shikimate dehydrogenase family protein [Brevundimonas sp. NPDC092305]|uniref:shikimate dehydrogenase family protein n=1 Tax=Brevundimonas sp. NPDC092305 TaxID=3363957 RepID=UPI00380EC5F0
MITGAAAVAGIAGDPIAHSLSPVMHNAWLAAAGMDGAYVPFRPRDPARFEALVAAGRAGLLLGLNVTAPFKEQAFGLADSSTDRARRVGSANILVFEDGRVHADSADGEGLLIALTDQAPKLTLRDSLVVVLGAGGAARAAVGSLVDAGAEVRLLNRSRDRAEALSAELGDRVSVAEDEAVVRDAALIINALSIQPAIDLDHLSAGAVVMDMTYRPVETAFLKAARARGLTTVDGLAMLVGQAAPSFEALFRRPPPPLDLRPLLLAHLEGVGG